MLAVAKYKLCRMQRQNHLFPLKTRNGESTVIESHSLQLRSLFLAVADEVPKLAGVHMVMDFDEVPFVELESTRVLLHQVPEALNKLGEDWRHLLGVPF